MLFKLILTKFTILQNNIYYKEIKKNGKLSSSENNLVKADTASKTITKWEKEFGIDFRGFWILDFDSRAGWSSCFHASLSFLMQLSALPTDFHANIALISADKSFKLAHSAFYEINMSYERSLWFSSYEFFSLSFFFCYYLP